MRCRESFTLAGLGNLNLDSVHELFSAHSIDATRHWDANIAARSVPNFEKSYYDNETEISNTFLS